MTESFRLMLALFGAGATGRAYKEEISGDITKVLVAAKHYKVLYVAYRGAKISAPGLLPDALSAKLDAKSKEHRLRSAAKQIRAVDFFTHLDGADIPWAIIKGVTVGTLYDDPLLRQSNDIDLLVPPEYEERALKIFTDNGFVPEYDRTAGSHHTELMHADYGLIELHIDIAEPEVIDVWCGGGEKFRLSAPYVKMSNEAGRFYGLCPGEALYSILFHTVKDFITGSPSVKGAMDLALTVRACPDEIIPGFEKDLQAKKLDKVVGAILGGMVKYCGFTNEELHGLASDNDAEIEAYYDDVESTAHMHHEMPTGAIKALADAHIKENGGEKTLSGTYSKFGLLFPPCDVMSRRYGYLKKAPFLLPFAWVCRIFSYIFMRTSDERRAESAESAAEKQASERRMTLYKMYGMIE